MAVQNLRRVLLVVAVLLIAIAIERLVNMLWIGRAFETYTTRAFVFQLSLAGGIAALICVFVIGRRP
jgi:hypothetical protein